MNGKAETTNETAAKPTAKYESTHLGWPEVWMLTAIFAIAGLVLLFGHITEEVLEGDATKFDQTILLFFRSANDLSDPIGPPWVEEMARDITALEATPF